MPNGDNNKISTRDPRLHVNDVNDVNTVTNVNKHKHTDKDEDFADFIADNYKFIGTTIKELLRICKDLWINVPDMVSSIIATVYNFIYKLIMRIRSHILSQITQDMMIMNGTKEIWAKLDINVLNDVSNNHGDPEQKHCRRIIQFLKNNDVNGFTKYCVENQMEPHFLTVINALISKLDIPSSFMLGLPNDSLVTYNDSSIIGKASVPVTITQSNEVASPKSVATTITQSNDVTGPNKAGLSESTHTQSKEPRIKVRYVKPYKNFSTETITNKQ